jgi:hypothetical protein
MELSKKRQQARAWAAYLSLYIGKAEIRILTFGKTTGWYRKGYM